MTYQLTEMEKKLLDTKRQFAAAAKRAADELDRQRKRLVQEIDRASSQARQAAADLQKKSETLASSTANRARRELRGQVLSLEKMIGGARADAARFRKDLGPVANDLRNARKHLAHALRIDKAMERVRKDLGLEAADRLPAPAQKAPVKKAAKKAAGKRVAAKTPASAKKVARKKAVAKKKPAAPPAQQAA